MACVVEPAAAGRAGMTNNTKNKMKARGKRGREGVRNRYIYIPTPSPPPTPTPSPPPTTTLPHPHGRESLVQLGQRREVQLVRRLGRRHVQQQPPRLRRVGRVLRQLSRQRRLLERLVELVVRPGPLLGPRAPGDAPVLAHIPQEIVNVDLFFSHMIHEHAYTWTR